MSSHHWFQTDSPDTTDYKMIDSHGTNDSRLTLKSSLITLFAKFISPVITNWFWCHHELQVVNFSRHHWLQMIDSHGTNITDWLTFIPTPINTGLVISYYKLINFMSSLVLNCNFQITTDYIIRQLSQNWFTSLLNRLTNIIWLQNESLMPSILQAN